jgi:hypothetical protein
MSEQTLIRQNAITCLFPGPSIGIDFLRRYGECLRFWAVGDIGATIDLMPLNYYFAGGGAIASLRVGISAS